MSSSPTGTTVIVLAIFVALLLLMAAVLLVGVVAGYGYKIFRSRQDVSQ